MEKYRINNNNNSASLRNIYFFAFNGQDVHKGRRIGE